MKNPRIAENIGLIKRAQAGDESAFSKIYKQYEKLVLNTIRMYIKDDDAARDLVVVTFTDVYENLSKFTEYTSFVGWLRTIACRNAIDYLRRRKTYADTESNDDRLSLVESISEEGESEIVEQVTMNQIREEFKRLVPQHKRICELYYVDELSIADIGKQLGIPAGTVKSVLSRVRKRIKNHLS